MTVKAFLRNHIKHLSNTYEISLVVNTDNPDLARDLNLSSLNIIPLPIARNISLFKDVIALAKLTGILRKNAFDAVHSVTPKAGLLAMLAAFFAGIKVRVHIFTGQIWYTKHGLGRFIFKSIDKFISALATNILVDSQSQRDFIINESVINPYKSTVLAEGSISGVDTERFNISKEDNIKQRAILSIPDNAFIFLFIGRMKRDKGIKELLSAFSYVHKRHNNVHLVLVGPDEEGILADVSKKLGESYVNYRHIGYTDQPEKLFSMADVFCLPSYREGFGTVIIEAAACGVPTIGSDIYGIQDAIVDGTTGFLVQAGDINAFAGKMELFWSDREMLRNFGINARKRAVNNFSQDFVTSKWLEYYNKLFEQR